MLGRPIIGHLDADCFYVSCERLRFPGLRGKPVGVLGNQGACVIAKSYEMKKAGVKFYMTTRVRYGGATNTFVSAQGIDSWADLDKPSPLVQALGQDGYRKVMDKRAQMITASEAQVVRYQPALSYVAAPR